MEGVESEKVRYNTKKRQQTVEVCLSERDQLV
jgi:hypothetical protein